MPPAPPRMTPAAIERYNAALLRSSGESAGLFDLDSLCQGLSRERLLRWLTAWQVPEIGPLFHGASPLTGNDWRHLLENRALLQVPAAPGVRWGMVTERCALRCLPTDLAVTRQVEDGFDDVLQESALLPGEPLALLHVSGDGQWTFAAASFARGWVPRAAVGLCRDWDDWKQAQAMEQFLVVTGSGFLLPQDPYAPELAGRELSLGMRLRLRQPPGTVLPLRGRMSYDSYLVELPIRETDGTLGFLPVLVPLSRPVHVGFLPYRPETVWHLASQLRGEVYGWGGRLGGRDCSALVQELFRCFGFQLPRSSRGLAQLPGAVSLAGRSPREKRALLRRYPPGTLLHFPGHVMLYGGEREGQHCCLSAAGSFRPPDQPDADMRVNTVVLTSLQVLRLNGESWLAALDAILPIPGGNDGSHPGNTPMRGRQSPSGSF